MPPIAVISNIHGNLPALKAAATDIKNRLSMILFNPLTKLEETAGRVGRKPC